MAEMVLGGAAEREGILARLSGAVAVQVQAFEARVRAGAEACVAEEMKLIQGILKTLEQLWTLHRRVAAEDSGAAPDVEGLRAQVMERLRSLRQTRVAAATPA